MSSYVVLARKWRPQKFSDLTGQGHVAQTLSNAIRQDRVPHALLFTGARGVGKTSSARILAMALNCAEGPTTEPCGVCDACEEIQRSQSVDVLEIDGASNRGINEIRELRDGVRYAPNRDRYKVYIIDEVHMLTTEAFNALLKTLEEPPGHVVFIFATTEAQKIPVTILSRCQRFDFRRIPHADIVSRLTEIADAEGLNIEPEVLGIVARQAAGGMRDALSILDQVIAFCGNDVALADVETILGAAERRRLFDLSAALLARDVDAALRVVDDVDSFGVDMSHFATELVAHLRDLAIVAVSQQPEELTALTDGEIAQARTQTSGVNVRLLHRMFEAMVDSAENIARSNHPRLLLEMALVRLTSFEATRDLAALVAQLEKMAGGAALPPGDGTPGPAGGGPPAPSAPQDPTPSGGGAQQAAPTPTSTDTALRSANTGPATEAGAAASPAEPERSDVQRHEPTDAPPPSDGPTGAPEPAHVAEPPVAAEPSVAAEPEVATGPEVAAEPATSAAPPVAAEPEVAPDPAAAAEPEVTPEPALSTEPALAAEPAPEPSDPRPAANDVALAPSPTEEASLPTPIASTDAAVSPPVDSDAPVDMTAPVDGERGGEDAAIHVAATTEIVTAEVVAAPGESDEVLATATAVVAVSATTTASTPADVGLSELTSEVWRELVDLLRDEVPHEGELMAAAKACPSGDEITVAVPDGLIERVKPDLMDRLGELAGRVSTTPYRFRFTADTELDDDRLAGAFHVRGLEEAEERARVASAKAYVREHSATSAIKKHFPGAEILRIAVPDTHPTETHMETR